MVKFATYFFRYSQEDLFLPHEWENRQQQHAQAEAAVMEMLNGMKHESGDIEKRKEVVA